MAAITATVIGATATAIGTGMAFSEASKQRKAATTARIEADKAIQEARRRAEENTYKALSLSKDPYERAREAALVQGAQATEAGIESERGAAATAGRIQMAQNELQRDIAGEQTQQIQALNMTVAEEDARLKDFAAKVSMAEAEGAQLAMKDAEDRRAASMIQGVQGLANTASTVGQSLDLYQKTKGARQYSKLTEQANAAGLDPSGMQNALGRVARNNPKYAALSGIESKSPQEAQAIISGLDVGLLGDLIEGNPFQTARPIPAPQGITQLPPNLFPNNPQYTPNSNVNPFDIYGR
jgi:hypothetical protein